MISKNLIFDLGFHNGTDTKFYLSKGYNVVAIEANPELVKIGQIEFESQIKSGQLILINKAISNKKGYVDFYIHGNKSDWSSCFKNVTETDGFESNHIIIESTNIKELFNKYGIPYYMKVDIEGYDSFVARQLFEVDKPKYVSFEISKKDYYEIFSWLYVSKYIKFQLRNQLNNSKYSSGDFGEFLPKDKWISYDELLTYYIKYKELKYIDNENLALGWIDVHAIME